MAGLVPAIGHGTVPPLMAGMVAGHDEWAMSHHRRGGVRTTVAFIVVALLGACGDSQPDRTQGGAAGGAATGAAVGLVGGPVGVAVGAVIGGGAGAIAGASTSPKDVDLGPPPWSNAKQ